MMIRKIFCYAALGSCMAFFAVFLLLPVFNVISSGCDAGLIMEIFRNHIYREGLCNSFLISIVTTLMVLMISLFLAFLYDRYDFPLRRYCGFFMLLLMILPPFVGALGFQQILGYYGTINTLLCKVGLPRVDFFGGTGKFWVICLVEALHLYPVLYLNLVAAMASVDPACDEAARICGASARTRFLKINLPLLKPGILAGVSIVMVWSFTELGTPLMFGYTRTCAVQIFNGLNELESNPVPYALVLIMLILSALMYLAARYSLRGNAVSAGKGMYVKTPVKPIWWQRWLVTSAFLLVTLLAVMPHTALVVRAFSTDCYMQLIPEKFTLANFQEALSNQLVLPSVVNSLRYSLLATLIALVCGIVISLAVCRWKLAGAKAADLLAMMPLAVPGVVVAFGFLSMSVKYQWAEKYFDPVSNPLWLLAIAYAVRRIPYVLRSLSSGLEQTPEEYELAARNYGASPLKITTRILLPLVIGNIVIGGLFAFSFSMLEVSDSLILAQKTAFYPITKALYELSQILGSGSSAASAFGVWMMAFLALNLAIGGAILGKKLGSLFRF